MNHGMNSVIIGELGMRKYWAIGSPMENAVRAMAPCISYLRRSQKRTGSIRYICISNGRLHRGELIDLLSFRRFWTSRRFATTDTPELGVNTVAGHEMRNASEVPTQRTLSG